MAAQVQNPPQPPPPNPPQPANAVGRPVPAGVGAAPTQLQAQGQPPAKEKGYVERAVHAIKDFIVRLFEKICCCFKKKDATPPPAAPKTPDPAPAQGQQPAPLPELRLRALLAGLDQLSDVDVYCEFNKNVPPDVQEAVYIKIGRGARIYSEHHAGQCRVKNNYELLRPYLRDYLTRITSAK